MDHRTERLTEAIREELAELISYEMTDPRVATVAVTDVHVSPDKRKVVIRFGVPSGEDAVAAAAGLEHGKSFLKRQLANRLDLYRTPDLYFEQDTTAMLGKRLDHILKRMKKGRPRDVHSGDTQKSPSE